MTDYLDKAVEAVAEKLYLNYSENPVLWEHENEGHRNVWRMKAGSYIEAAEPFIAEHHRAEQAATFGESVRLAEEKGRREGRTDERAWAHRLLLEAATE